MSTREEHQPRGCPPTAGTTNARRELGRQGEDLAARRLRACGYDVLARNVRTRHGEIDLIACDRCTLVFAEVKTRCAGVHQTTIRADQEPLLALGRRQQYRLRRLAAAWLRDAGSRRPSARTIRFDAIGVVIDTRGRLRRIEHIEGAF